MFVPKVWLHFFCGTYTNLTCVFASPAGLWKVMKRVPVLCDLLLASVYIYFVLNILQVHRTSLILLIFGLCVFHLLHHHSLILKLVLGCDCKLSVVHIKIGHNYLLTLQAYGRLWLGCQFFIPLAIINWLTRFKSISPKVSCLVFWSVYTFIYL